MLKNIEDLKIKAISEVSEIELDKVRESYDEENFESLGYIALTESEANNTAAELILDTAWAFSPEYLEDVTGIDAEVFEILTSKCETSNRAILSIIEKTFGIDEFIEQSILLDGRGHFIASYDGVENEVYIDGEMIYVYRV